MSLSIDALVDTFICPQCSGSLEWAHDRVRLNCRACPLTYPVSDGVPVLRIDHATARASETDSVFEQLVADALEAPFSGWDWAWLTGRRTSESLPNDLAPAYAERAQKLVASATAMLDVGTGGGEQLALYAPFPTLAVATEAYPPNVSIAAAQLAPLGVQVVGTDPNTHNSRGPGSRNRWPERRLPFSSATFDLVLARNSAFSPAEVARVLTLGGTLLTINGHTEWRGETLADALGASPPEWTLPGLGWDVGHSLFEAGFRINQWREASTRVSYRDIGAIVYTLLHIPWIIPDFRLDRYRARLYELHRRMQRDGGLTTTSYAYLVEAQT